MKIIEATLIMPITILITITMLIIMMTFYGTLKDQIELHNEEREKMYDYSDFTKVRIYETAK